MQSLLQRTTAFLTPNTSSTNLSKASAQPSPTSASSPSSSTASRPIFPAVDPSTDGPDCLQDCSTCTVHYPAKWSIDESDPLYGHVAGWATHLLVATGKTDWVRDVADERGSVMEAIGKYGTELENGRCMVSACNMPVPDYECEGQDGLGRDEKGRERERNREEGETEVLVLPKWQIVEGVRPARVGEFMEGYVGRVASTMSPVSAGDSPIATGGVAKEKMDERVQGNSHPPASNPSSSKIPRPITTQFPTRPCPHHALILLCSQKTRDARCGQSAPLLRREFERHLRPLGLYRDIHDRRPGGVGIYFISHVGGHRYAANVMVYRQGSVDGEREGEEVGLIERSQTENGSGNGNWNGVETVSEPSIKEAVQCIWLARVRPEDCEGIIKYTVLEGKVVKPERQLRGGFDRRRGLTSW